ncbi:sel1 repeat family protein [Jeongeupia chitinilytica]|uniref:Sel1 repeat family protein n=1 Tax=Jeongeupia chitinilytica TaxID=1041641 RepID=A0ABQ3H3W2_9NEIS|nr:sel1 repeat family protein [Jeongeupia chitinilytica]GHD69130.1 hypothetical protein GCM10007350_35470 [Jeongeupia chitinilytica]
MKKWIIAAVCCAGVTAQAAESVIEAALTKHDYALAFASATADVKDGSATDWTRLQLAQLYQRGLGTQADPAAAIRLLTPLAEKDNVDAQLLLSASLASRATEGLVQADGKLNPERYKALAARPVSARGDDRRAAEWLWRAAEAGQSDAVQAVAQELAGSINGVPRDEVAMWFEKADKKDWLVPLKANGSLTSLKLRRDVIRDETLGQRLEAAARKAQCIDENLALKDVRIAAPLTGAQYLTLEFKPPVRYKLITGQWQETWVFAACDKTFPVDIAFTADGMGGARYEVVTPAAK